ncbi:hypothetical protein [Streptomyces hygroscopicus]|uniref:hypothetical protein n=1 Tax=Streptomyces hygroscopicus TaxID=1912 RepID=UPI0007DB2682|nr:hypothetical protein [Streptomyces sp. NBRC 109436]
MSSRTREWGGNRLHWDEAYQGPGRVFTYQDGTALKSPYVSQCCKLLIERYGKLRQRHAEGWTAERIASSTGRQWRRSESR